MRKILVLTLVFFLAAGSVSAREGVPTMIREFWTGPAHVPAPSISAEGEVHGKRDNIHASTTVRAEAKRDDKKHATSSPVLWRGVPGVVTSVGSSSFVMTMPSMKDHATTTVTVNVSNSTVFKHGSTTASLSDINAGTRVEVLGKVSTSTKTITAERVMIGGEVKKDDHKDKKDFGGIKSFLKRFFDGKHASTTSNTEIHAETAAAVQSGLLKSIFSSVFGWM